MPPSNLPLTYPLTDQLKDQIRYLESLRNHYQIENLKLREILKAAEKVRNRQKTYFSRRSKGALRATINAEKELDGLIEQFYGEKSYAKKVH
jgi:regulator of replication initiation timing